MANEAIAEKLKSTLSASEIEIIDNSWQHAGHMAMANVNEASGTHLAIRIISEQFEGLNLIKRHQAVHQVLKEDFAKQLHALELKTYTPQEWAQKQHD